MKPLIRDRLFHYIDEHVDAKWKLWQQLQAIMKTAPASCVPQDFCSVLVGLLQEAGIHTRILDLPQPAIYGIAGEAKPGTLLFYLPVYHCHYLAPLVYSLAAAQAYQATLGHLSPTIKWLLDFGTGEHLSTIIANDRALLQANGCLWYGEEQHNETSPTFALGTKGLLRVKLHIRTGAGSVPTMHAGVLPNALWRLLWALNSLKSTQEEILIDGFYDTIQPLADNLTSLLYNLPDNAPAFAAQMGLAEPLLSLQGWQFHYAHLLTPTCTVSSIRDTTSVDPLTSARNSSDGDPAIPIQATARLEFLLVPQQDPHDIYHKLCAHLQTQGFADIEVQMQQSIQPVWTELQHPFVQAIQQSSSAIYGRAPYLMPLSSGSYPLASLHSMLNMPVVLDLTSAPLQEVVADKIRQHMAQQIKQLVLIIFSAFDQTDNSP